MRELTVDFERGRLADQDARKRSIATASGSLTSPLEASTSPMQFENTCRSSSSFRPIGRVTRAPSAITPSSRSPLIIGTAINVLCEEPTPSRRYWDRRSSAALPSGPSPSATSSGT